MAHKTCTITIDPNRSFRVVVDDQMNDEYANALLRESFWLTFDWQLLSRFLPAQGGRFLDLGGHLGSFALTAAAHGMDVLVVEASPKNAAMIRASVAANKFDRLAVVNAAIYSDSRPMRFFENGPYGFLVESDDTRLPLVPALPMDEILARQGWDRVDGIKMDIEGAEVWAVEAMAEILSRPDAPVIYYECNGRTLNDVAHATCGRLRRRLEDFGYTNFVCGEPGVPLRPTSADELHPEIVSNCLAVKLSAFPVQSASLWTRTVGNLRRKLRGEKPIAGWLRGYPIGFAFTEAEQIANFKRVIAMANANQISPAEPMIGHQQLLRELAHAPQWLLSDPAVSEYLKQQSPAAERLAA